MISSITWRKVTSLQTAAMGIRLIAIILKDIGEGLQIIAV